MQATSNWHSDGLRWIAANLADLADFLDRMDSAPGGRASMTPGEAIDDARARILARYY
jgi:hypothetical protein